MYIPIYLHIQSKNMLALIHINFHWSSLYGFTCVWLCVHHTFCRNLHLCFWLSSTVLRCMACFRRCSEAELRQRHVCGCAWKSVCMYMCVCALWFKVSLCRCSEASEYSGLRAYVGERERRRSCVLVRVFVFVWVCVCVWTHLCVHVRVRMRMCASQARARVLLPVTYFSLLCIFGLICLCTYASIYLTLFVSLFLALSTPLAIVLCVYMCVYAYVCVCVRQSEKMCISDR